MSDPRDDDEALDGMLAALGAPPGATPTTSASQLLALAVPPPMPFVPRVGVPRWVLGASVGASLVAGFGGGVIVTSGYWAGEARDERAVVVESVDAGHPGSPGVSGVAVLEAGRRGGPGADAGGGVLEAGRRGGPGADAGGGVLEAGRRGGLPADAGGSSDEPAGAPAGEPTRGVVAVARHGTAEAGAAPAAGGVKGTAKRGAVARERGPTHVHGTPPGPQGDVSVARVDGDERNANHDDLRDDERHPSDAVAENDTDSRHPADEPRLATPATAPTGRTADGTARAQHAARNDHDAPLADNDNADAPTARAQHAARATAARATDRTGDTAARATDRTGDGAALPDAGTPGRPRPSRADRALADRARPDRATADLHPFREPTPWSFVFDGGWAATRVIGSPERGLGELPGASLPGAGATVPVGGPVLGAAARVMTLGSSPARLAAEVGVSFTGALVPFVAPGTFAPDAAVELGWRFGDAVMPSLGWTAGLNVRLPMGPPNELDAMSSPLAVATGPRLGLDVGKRDRPHLRLRLDVQGTPGGPADGLRPSVAFTGGVEIPLLARR